MTIQAQAVSTDELKQELFNTLLGSIKEGDFDSQLRDLRQAVRNREFKVANQIKVGDRIKVTGNMSPKYIVGVTGEITAREGGKNPKFWVNLDQDHPNLQGRKYGSGGDVGFPIHAVTKID